MFTPLIYNSCLSLDQSHGINFLSLWNKTHLFLQRCCLGPAFLSPLSGTPGQCRHFFSSLASLGHHSLLSSRQESAVSPLVGLCLHLWPSQDTASLSGFPPPHPASKEFRGLPLSRVQPQDPPTRRLLCFSPQAWLNFHTAACLLEHRAPRSPHQTCSFTSNSWLPRWPSLWQRHPTESYG